MWSCLVVVVLETVFGLALKDGIGSIDPNYSNIQAYFYALFAAAVLTIVLVFALSVYLLSEVQRFAWSCLIGAVIVATIWLVGAATDLDWLTMLLAPGFVFGTILTGGVHGDHFYSFYVVTVLTDVLFFALAVYQFWYFLLRTRLTKS